MGAWIEIRSRSYQASDQTVAPYMGAWIEIYKRRNYSGTTTVAPYMGAWIEIVVRITHFKAPFSRSLHGSVD